MSIKEYREKKFVHVMCQKEAVIYVYALNINPAIQIPTTKYKVYDGYNAQATLRTIMHKLCIKSHSELSPCTNP